MVGARIERASPALQTSANPSQLSDQAPRPGFDCGLRIVDLKRPIRNLPVPTSKSGSRESNSDSPAPRAGGFPSSLDPEWLRRQDSNLRMVWLTTRCLTSLATPHSDCGLRVADLGFLSQLALQSAILNPQSAIPMGRVGVEPTTSRLKVENSS